MRLGRRWLGLCLACVGLSAAFACRQIVGIGDQPPMGPATATCGLSFPGACGECLAANCCAEAQTCANLMSCSTYAACLATCNGEEQCRANCTVKDVIGTTLADGVPASALRACLGTACGSECNLGCGNAEYVAPPENARECASCESVRLCDAVSADAGFFHPDASPAAYDLFARCTVACTTPDCQQSCGPSVLDVDAAVVLSTGQCSTQCAEGEYWACLDNFAWPFATAGTCELQFNVDTQHAGATAVVCATDVTGKCTSVLADASVNDAGYAVMQLPLDPGSSLPGPGVGGEYVFLSMPNDDAGTLVPTLTYWGFPLSQPKYSLGTFVFSRADLDGLLMGVDVVPLPGHGHIAAVVWDCRGDAAKDVTVELHPPAPETAAFILTNNTLVPGNVTHDSNIVAFSNVPVTTNVQVTATIPDGGATMADLPVVVRDGELTVVNLIPQPH